MTDKEKAKQKKIEKQVANLMSILDCTREEALDIIKTDDIINHNGKTEYDLSADKVQAASEISAIKDRKAKGENNQRGKARAENPTRQTIITEIYNCLNENAEIGCENVEIVNKEKKISFKIGENVFSLDLVQHRKPKK